MVWQTVEVQVVVQVSFHYLYYLYLEEEEVGLLDFCWVGVEVVPHLYLVVEVQVHFEDPYQ